LACDPRLLQLIRGYVAFGGIHVAQAIGRSATRWALVGRSDALMDTSTNYAAQPGRSSEVFSETISHPYGAKRGGSWRYCTMTRYRCGKYTNQRHRLPRIRRRCSTVRRHLGSER